MFSLSFSVEPHAQDLTGRIIPHASSAGRISSGGIQGAGAASEAIVCSRSFPSVISDISEGAGSSLRVRAQPTKPLCAQPSRWLGLNSLLGGSEGFFTVTRSRVQGVLSKALQQSFVSFLECMPGVGNNKTLLCLTYFLPPLPNKLLPHLSPLPDTNLSD